MLLRWYCKAQTWMSRQEGASVVEYVVLATLVVLAIYAAIKMMGCELQHQLENVVRVLQGQSTTASVCK